jgi:hypothetical protein
VVLTVAGERVAVALPPGHETSDEPSFVSFAVFFLDLACFAETQRASPEAHR